VVLLYCCVCAWVGGGRGGGGGKVIVIDTEGTFRPARVGHIAEARFGLEPEVAWRPGRVPPVWGKGRAFPLREHNALSHFSSHSPVRVLGGGGAWPASSGVPGTRCAMRVQWLRAVHRRYWTT
jgi:hypothetical protein